MEANCPGFRAALSCRSFNSGSMAKPLPSTLEGTKKILVSGLPLVQNEIVQETGYRIVQLPNGAHSLHSIAYGETMHPAVGPAAEAEDLYVRQLKLRERI